MRTRGNMGCAYIVRTHEGRRLGSDAPGGRGVGDVVSGGKVFCVEGGEMEPGNGEGGGAVEKG